MSYKPVRKTLESVGEVEDLMCKLVKGDMKDIVLTFPSDGGRARIGFHRKYRTFAANIKYPLTDYMLRIACEKIPNLPEKRFHRYYVEDRPLKTVVERAIPLDEKQVVYRLFIDFDKDAIVHMVLPDELTKPDKFAGNYSYKLVAAEKMKELFEIGEAVMRDSITRHHVFNNVRRIKSECVSQICFEPTTIQRERISKILYNMLTDEAGVTNVRLRFGDFNSYYKFQYVMKITPSRADGVIAWKPPSTITASNIFDEMIEAIGMSIPANASLTADEKFTSRLEQWVSDLGDCVDYYMNMIRDLSMNYYRGVIVDPFLSLFYNWKERKQERKRREEHYLKKWLEGIKVVPNDEREKSCIVLINSECALKVKSGKPPEEGSIK